ncbi:MAG: A24 family peptidase [Elusimicrobia bacterium]|nr:A24 family peptidase [Elusimicrobiota bacterium]
MIFDKLKNMDIKSFIIDALFISFVLLSACTDIFYRKIFNSLTYPAIILGITLNCLYFGLYGLKLSLLGLFTGFALLFILYILGAIGAGDVKFMAAVGSIKGAEFVFMGGLYGVITAGIFAVVILIKNKRFFSTIKDIFIGVFFFLSFRKYEHIKFEDKKSIYLPYAAYIAIGMIVFWLEKHK